MKKPWSKERALEVYKKLFPGDRDVGTDDKKRDNDIAQDMNRARMAETVGDAAAWLEWWCYDPEWVETARGIAARIRRFK